MKFVMIAAAALLASGCSTVSALLDDPSVYPKAVKASRTSTLTYCTSYPGRLPVSVCENARNDILAIQAMEAEDAAASEDLE